MAELQTKYLIIGAGISGLTFANYVKNEEYLIIEKEDRIGGYCKTNYKGEYTWDYAGHFFHFKTEEMKNLFKTMMKDEEILFQNKNTKIMYNQELVDYPFQMNIHQLDKEEFIDCLYDLFNKKEKDEYDSFLDMLYGKFGKSIVEKFLKPYNEKLYACDLNSLDKDAMGRFFPYANPTQIINNMKNSNNSSYNNTFLYPRKGAVSFLNKIYEGLDSNKVLLSKEMSYVDFDNKIVKTVQGDTIKYEYLINTSPLNQFLLLSNKDEDKQIEKMLSYNKVLVFNIGFEKAGNNKEHWIYIPDKDVNFYRVGFYNNILNEDKLSMYIEIGYSKDANIDIDGEFQRTKENLEKCGITENNKIVDYEAIVMDPAYVHIKEDTSELIREYMHKINQKSVYSIGRYGAWTYCSMEDAMIVAKELADTLSKK